MVFDEADNLVLFRCLDQLDVMGKKLSGWLRHEDVHSTLDGIHADREVSTWKTGKIRRKSRSPETRTYCLG